MGELRIKHLTVTTSDKTQLLRTEDGEEDMIVRAGEVVTLEGPNQSGKTTIVSTIAGAFQLTRKPGSKDAFTVAYSMTLDGQDYVPTSIRDAMNRGVVAVFQNDPLIPTMTTFEQYVLRHGAPTKLGGFTNFFWAQLRALTVRVARKLAASWDEPLGSRVEALADALPQQSRSRRDISTAAKEWLALFYPRWTEADQRKHLNKFPMMMSGGERSVMRVVGALLQKDIRFLILDEAFTAVDLPTWTGAVEVIRKHVVAKGIGVIVVSHSPAERTRWRPTRRYEIVQGSLACHSSPAKAKHVVQGIVKPGRDIPIFETAGWVAAREGDCSWTENFPATAIAIVDKNVRNHPATSQLLTMLEARGDLSTLDVDISEKTKSVPTAQEIIRAISSHVRTENGTIYCVGGGSLLNIGGFCASIYLRGRVPTIYVPTTLTAIADVAVGSKTAINYVGDGDLPIKHVIGSYFDPSGIAVDCRYLQSLSRSDTIVASAEIVKQALVQSGSLFEEVLNNLELETPDLDRAYRHAVAASLLKQEVMLEDVDERSIGRILQFGHLHAHSLERASDFAIPHSVAVWCGLLIDYRLSLEAPNQSSDLSRLEKLAKTAAAGRQIPSQAMLFKGYQAETKMEPNAAAGEYSVTLAPSAGFYAEVGRTPLQTAVVDWSRLRSEWDRLRDILELAPVAVGRP